MSLPSSRNPLTMHLGVPLFACSIWLALQQTNWPLTTDPDSLYSKISISHVDNSARSRFWGATTTYDGKVVFAPFKSANILVYDDASGTMEAVDIASIRSTASASSDLFMGAGTTHEGVVLFAPYQIRSIGIYVPWTKAFSLFDLSGKLTANTPLYSDVLIAPNNKAIFVPAKADIGVFQFATGTFTTIHAGSHSSWEKFRGGCIDGDIVYMSPRRANFIGVFNTDNHGYSSVMVPDSIVPNNLWAKFSKCAATSSGYVVFPPAGAEALMVMKISTQELFKLEFSDADTGERCTRRRTQNSPTWNKYSLAITDAYDQVVCAPHQCGRFWVVDPQSMTMKVKNSYADASGHYNYGVAGPRGRIFFTPGGEYVGQWVSPISGLLQRCDNWPNFDSEANVQSDQTVEACAIAARTGSKDYFAMGKWNFGNVSYCLVLNAPPIGKTSLALSDCRPANAYYLGNQQSAVAIYQMPTTTTTTTSTTTTTTIVFVAQGNFRFNDCCSCDSGKVTKAVKETLAAEFSVVEAAVNVTIKPAICPNGGGGSLTGSSTTSPAITNVWIVEFEVTIPFSQQASAQAKMDTLKTTSGAFSDDLKLRLVAAGVIASATSFQVTNFGIAFRVTIAPSTTSIAGATIDEGDDLPIMVLALAGSGMVFVFCMTLAILVFQTGACHQKKHYTKRQMKMPWELPPHLLDPANEESLFNVNFSMEYLLNPPEKITHEHCDDLKHAVKLLADSLGHMGDFEHEVAEVCICFAMGKREGDVENSGPGMYYAAAIMKLLFGYGIPCYCSLLEHQPSSKHIVGQRMSVAARYLHIAHMGPHEAFMKRLKEPRKCKLKVLLVVMTEGLLKSTQAMEQIAACTKVPDIKIIPLRFEAKLPIGHTRWEDVRWGKTKKLLQQLDAVETALQQTQEMPAPPGSMVAETKTFMTMLQQISCIIDRLVNWHPDHNPWETKEHDASWIEDWFTDIHFELPPQQEVDEHQFDDEVSQPIGFMGKVHARMSRGISRVSNRHRPSKEQEHLKASTRSAASRVGNCSSILNKSGAGGIRSASKKSVCFHDGGADRPKQSPTFGWHLKGFSKLFAPLPAAGPTPAASTLAPVVDDDAAVVNDTKHDAVLATQVMKRNTEQCEQSDAATEEMKELFNQMNIIGASAFAKSGDANKSKEPASLNKAISTESGKARKSTKTSPKRKSKAMAKVKVKVNALTNMLTPENVKEAEGDSNTASASSANRANSASEPEQDDKWMDIDEGDADVKQWRMQTGKLLDFDGNKTGKAKKENAEKSMPKAEGIGAYSEVKSAMKHSKYRARSKSKLNKAATDVNTSSKSKNTGAAKKVPKINIDTDHVVRDEEDDILEVEEVEKNTKAENS